LGRNADVRLSDWRVGTLAGWRPAVAFNATVAETGERLVFSDLRLNTIQGECVTARASASAQCDSAIDAETAWSWYPDNDLNVVRAARLSAAFPFVSPISKPWIRPLTKKVDYHVADGGYYDNFGIVTTVEWVRKAKGLWSGNPANATLPKPHVLLVEIRESDYREGNATEPKRRAGWTYAFTGPLATMLEVRRSSQATRNDLDLQLLGDWVQMDGWTLDRAVFVLPSDAPMSWQLAQRQKDDIEMQWSVCRASPATLTGQAYATVARVLESPIVQDAVPNPICAKPKQALTGRSSAASGSR
jgi:hypothetical protein